MRRFRSRQSATMNSASRFSVNLLINYGFGDNLTVFTGTTAPQHAVNNWIRSPGHFQTMICPDCGCIGVTCCCMFVGTPDSINFYA